MSLFQKATKTQAKARISMQGPSGSGKTLTGLYTARALVGPDGRIAVIDTENGSARKYADIVDFDVLELEPPYHPDRFIAAINAAAEEGYDVVFVDSLSHAWKGEGGMLQLVDKIAKRKKSGNSYAAWGDADPVWQNFVEGIVRCPIHLIGAMRAKTEYVLEKNSRGKMAPRKVGMEAVQRDGFEFEFDVIVEMDLDHNAIISKTRCMDLDGEVFSRPNDEIGNALREWLSDGAPVDEDADPKPQPEIPSDKVGSNGNSGSGRQAKPKKRPATEKQVGYLKGLVSSKDIGFNPETGESDPELAEVNEAKLLEIIDGDLTADKASNLIERLKALPDNGIEIDPDDKPSDPDPKPEGGGDDDPFDDGIRDDAETETAESGADDA